MLLTITRLAKKYGTSRTTILYYEREQLLLPHSVGENGYRYYTQVEQSRLELILAYRKFGLSVQEIKSLLCTNSLGEQFDVFHQQVASLEAEINQLRTKQQAIIKVLQSPKMLKAKQITKADWVNVLQSSGFSEDDMIRWHQSFEQKDPKGHELFLQTLGITADEIRTIRSL